MSSGASGYLTMTAPPVDLAKLFAALAEVAAEMQNPAKSAKARIPLKAGGAFEFAYAPLDAILAQTRPLLAAHGLSVIQYPVDVAERAGVRTWIVHSAGGSFDCGTVSLPVGDDPKALGAAITYLRRYAYCAALNIAADDDNDVAPMQTARKKSGGAAGTATTGPAPFQRRPQDPSTPGPSVEGGSEPRSDDARQTELTDDASSRTSAPSTSVEGSEASLAVAAPSPGVAGSSQPAPSTSSEPAGELPGGRSPAGTGHFDKEATIAEAVRLCGGDLGKLMTHVRAKHPEWKTDPTYPVKTFEDLEGFHYLQIIEDYAEAVA